EKMVAHREKKGFAEVVSGRKKRDAILFLPVAVFDEGRAEAGRSQLLDLLDHAPAFVADHKVDACDPCVDQGIQRVRNQRTAKHGDEGLQESFIRTAETRALAGHQNYRFRDSSHIWDDSMER